MPSHATPRALPVKRQACILSQADPALEKREADLRSFPVRKVRNSKHPNLLRKGQTNFNLTIKISIKMGILLSTDGSLRFLGLLRMALIPFDGKGRATANEGERGRTKPKPGIEACFLLPYKATPVGPRPCSCFWKESQTSPCSASANSMEQSKTRWIISGRMSHASRSQPTAYMSCRTSI